MNLTASCCIQRPNSFSPAHRTQAAVSVKRVPEVTTGVLGAVKQQLGLLVRMALAPGHAKHVDNNARRYIAPAAACPLRRG